MWEPVTRGNPSEAAFIARCLLGEGVVGANQRLSMLDLRVWAALCGLLWQQHGDDLDRASEREVLTTGFELRERVFGSSHGGADWLALRNSLVRLASVRASVRTVQPDPELAAQQVVAGYVSLLGDIWLATAQLDLRTPHQWGALKGTSSLRVEIGRWVAEQVLAGAGAWLDLDVLRSLGAGLSARVWAALEGWARWPARTLDGREECAIGLGKPALESLGVAGYQRPQDARRALVRAGRRIVASDPAYHRVTVERRGGGWCIVVERTAGSRQRAAERREWRSQPRVETRTGICASLARATANQSARELPALRGFRPDPGGETSSTAQLPDLAQGKADEKFDPDVFAD